MNLELCWLLLRRELLVSLRRRSDLANPLFFFLIVCALFPLGLGPSPALLAGMAPGLLWIAQPRVTLFDQSAESARPLVTQRAPADSFVSGIGLDVAYAT